MNGSLVGWKEEEEEEEEKEEEEEEDNFDFFSFDDILGPFVVLY